MAVRSYVQTALSQVKSALADLEAQNNSRHQEADNAKRQLQSEITSMDLNKSQKQTEAMQLSDPNVRRGLELQVAELVKQIDAKKVQIAQVDKDVTQREANKAQLYKGLYDINAKLTSFMSLPQID
jgi:chromosome segregation ATPase